MHDILFNTASNFEKNWFSRIEHISKSKEKIIEVPNLKPYPKTFFYKDITSDPNHWKNKTFSKNFAPEGGHVIIRH